MKLNDIDFIKLLPAFMRDDEANNGLSVAVNTLTQDLDRRIRLLSTWDNIDVMTAEELDLLADELHITWYDKSAVIDVKRQIIKESDIVHSKLGTNWAVMNVIDTYFGEGQIIDWYDYGGEPFHFKIQTINQTVLNEKMQSFMRILEAVKRQSAVLDAVELIESGYSKVHVYVLSVQSDLVITNVKR